VVEVKTSIVPGGTDGKQRTFINDMDGERRLSGSR